MDMRQEKIKRKTTETEIELRLNLDGAGKYNIKTGVGFFDHMLEQFARHGRFDLAVACTGDTHVDAHHTVEDVGIALGQAFSGALGAKRGIVRYGSFHMPMDEALVLAVVDISGRVSCNCLLDIPAAKVGEFDTELVEEFVAGFTRGLGASVHLRQLAGSNSHHIIEAVFKGLGRALAQAVALDPRLGDEVPSTKGML